MSLSASCSLVLEVRYYCYRGVGMLVLCLCYGGLVMVAMLSQYGGYVMVLCCTLQVPSGQRLERLSILGRNILSATVSLETR